MHATDFCDNTSKLIL